MRLNTNHGPVGLLIQSMLFASASNYACRKAIYFIRNLIYHKYVDFLREINARGSMGCPWVWLAQCLLCLLLRVQLTSFPNRDCPMIATLMSGLMDFALKCIPGMVCDKYLLYRVAAQGVVLGRMRKPCRTAARESEDKANIRTCRSPLAANCYNL